MRRWRLANPRRLISLPTPRAVHSHQWIVWLAALAAILAAAGYLIWRVTSTLQGAAAWLALPLLAAEAWGFLQLLLLAWQGWRVPRDGPPWPTATPSAAVVVLAGDDNAALERTLVSARAAEGAGTLVVMASAAAPGQAALVARYGGRYVVGSLKDALARLEDERVLLLRAGEVAMPDVLERSAGWLDTDRRTAAVQLRVEFANPDGLSHVFSGRSEQDLANEVLAPSLGRRGLSPLTGSALLIRREAMAGALNDDGTMPLPAVLSARVMGRARTRFAPAGSCGRSGPTRSSTTWTRRAAAPAARWQPSSGAAAPFDRGACGPGPAWPSSPPRAATCPVSTASRCWPSCSRCWPRASCPCARRCSTSRRSGRRPSSWRPWRASPSRAARWRPATGRGTRCAPWAPTSAPRPGVRGCPATPTRRAPEGSGRSGASGCSPGSCWPSTACSSCAVSTPGRTWACRRSPAAPRWRSSS